MLRAENDAIQLINVAMSNKRLIKPALGFKSMTTVYTTIKGFEVMRMFNKGQFVMWTYDQGLKGEIRQMERQFDIYSTA